MGEDLEPCPFCGKRDSVVLTNQQLPDFIVAHWVWCNGCAAIGPRADSKAKALAKWKHRAALSAEAK